MTLAQYLDESRCSPLQLAERLGVSRVAVGRYLSGKRIPEPEVMRRLAEITTNLVTANDFYGIDKPPRPARRVARRVKPQPNQAG